MRILSWLITLLVCLTVTGGLAGFKYRQISEAMAMAASFPPPYSVVTATSVEQQEWTAVRRLTGTVRAPQFVELTAEATGRIINLAAAAGTVVAKGDVIVQLFDDDLKAQQEALSADLSLVELQLKRTRQLRNDGMASQDQLDTLEARELSLKAQIAATEARISRLALRAPFTGKLGIYTQSVGDLMQAGDQLTTLHGTGDRRWIDFKIPQGVARVAVGDSVRLLSLDREIIGDAKITAVADALGTGLRAFDVRAEVNDARLRHGELVLIEVRTRQPEIVFTLPVPAVRWDTEGPHVFVLEDGKPDAYVPLEAQLRRINVIGEEHSVIMAQGDLQVGEQIALKGAFKLSDGGLVKLATASAGQ
jgi:membrane fusion protein (multidrug efflux system)